MITKYYYTDRNKKIGSCKITINQALSIVMVTELHENRAESVTNSLPIIAKGICEYFKISPKKLLLLERWTDEDSYGRMGGNSVTVFVQFAKPNFEGAIEIEVLEEEYVQQLFD